MMKENDINNETKQIKIILLGDSGVGKTNIILRYLNDLFDPNSTSTIGTSFGTKELVRNNIIYNLNIWDTTGQEIYRAVTKMFIQDSKIIILVYSINNKNTFESLEYWYDTIKQVCGDNFILAIVGNKQDLFDQEDEENNSDFVSEEDGKEYADSKKAFFKLVSAKIDKKGIDTLFEQLLDEYIKKFIITSTPVIKNEEKNESSIIISKEKNSKKKNKKKCC